VRIWGAASIDELAEAVSIWLPRAIRSTGHLTQVDHAEYFADLGGPGPELMGKDVFRVTQVGRGERDLEGHGRRPRAIGVHVELTLEATIWAT
jgi:hypothetical protein